jgi:hypothetical protein
VSRGVRRDALVRASERDGKKRLYLIGVKGNLPLYEWINFSENRPLEKLILIQQKGKIQKLCVENARVGEAFDTPSHKTGWSAPELGAADSEAKDVSC